MTKKSLAVHNLKKHWPLLTGEQQASFRLATKTNSSIIKKATTKAKKSTKGKKRLSWRAVIKTGGTESNRRRH